MLDYRVWTVGGGGLGCSGFGWCGFDSQYCLRNEQVSGIAEFGRYPGTVPT